MLDSLSELGLLSQLFLVFVAGIGTSLTPCVYPLIPVTLTLFGADQSTSRWRSFSLALTYVTGIAVTFCFLGLVSATTGALFGSILSFPPVIIALATIMIFLAGSSLDMFHIPYLHTIQGKASRVGSVGYRGAFLAGSVSGLVASPCVGPALVAILVFVAQSGDLFRGTLLLLSFALGMGMLFLLLGTYSNLLSRIPRSGHWMNVIKYVMAVALCFYAIFLLQTLLPLEKFEDTISPYTSLAIPAVVLLTLTAYSGYKWQSHFLKATSCLFTSFVIFLFVFLSPAKNNAADDATSTLPLTWHHSYEQALQFAKTSHKPVFFDLYADWCVACKELDKTTFQDPAVKQLFQNFVLAKIDFTAPNDDTNALSERYGVVGLPWLFVTTENGVLVDSSVITGYVDAQEMVERLKKSYETYARLKGSPEAETH